MLKESMVNLGFERSDVWFILQLTNPEDSIVHKNLHLSNPILDEVDIYALQDGTWQLVGQGGDQRVQALHQYDYLSFPLAFQPKKEHLLLLRVNNGGEQFYFNVSLEETNFSQIKQSKNQLFFGVLFGIMGFIILLNLAVGILFKQRIAYWYTGYALTFTLLQFSLLGLASKYLWPELTFMINRANPLFTSLGVFFFLKFTLEYLNIQKHLPRFTHVFEKFQWVLLANAFLSLIPLPIFLWITAISINGMTLLLNLGIFIPLLIILRKQERAAYTYLIAFSLLQVTVFIFILRNFGIIPDSFLAAYGLQLGTALEMIILTIGILQRFKYINDESILALAEANAMKDNLNVQLEQEVRSRTAEVIEQRNELAEKNAEIVDSINYAQRIQQAILPSIDDVYRPLLFHLWYLPKDIVAGDFYWISVQRIQDQEVVFFAVADCTGHGVPGAMLSVLCTNALNESVRKLKQPSPALLLEYVNDYLKAYLSTNTQHLADGMDISIACFDQNSYQLRWSGANNPLWVSRSATTHFLDPTKRPVGKSEREIPFEELEMQLQKGDRLFLFSDGYPDQFGGEQGKKIKTKGLRGWYETSLHLKPNEQLEFLKNAFQNWKHAEEQLDDVCILLVEVN
jgi:serine phosphatase RsbU (regulator of sigma subunit)